MEDEELRRALDLSCKEAEKDDPDLAFALAVSMEEYRVQIHVPRVASRRSSEEDLQEALRRSCLETGREQEQKGRGAGRDKSNRQAEPRATFKPQEVALHPTPSRVKTGEMRRPQEGGSPYTSSRQQSKPPGPVGEEAGKDQSWYTQDTPRDKHIGSRRLATHKGEEVNRRAAQNHGVNKDRPGFGHPRDREERGWNPGAKM